MINICNYSLRQLAKTKDFIDFTEKFIDKIESLIPDDDEEGKLNARSSSGKVDFSVAGVMISVRIYL